MCATMYIKFKPLTIKHFITFIFNTKAVIKACLQSMLIFYQYLFYCHSQHKIDIKARQHYVLSFHIW